MTALAAAYQQHSARMCKRCPHAVDWHARKPDVSYCDVLIGFVDWDNECAVPELVLDEVVEVGE